MNFAKIKETFFNLIFPKFCLGCKKEGFYFCQDCLATLEIFTFHEKFRGKNLADLYFPINYENFLVKKLIQNFKYPPLIKELKRELAQLIISHFLLLDKKPDFSDFILMPIPLSKKKLKWRGFNQAEEIAKELAEFFKIPLISDCLFKMRETKDQVELSEKERKENVKGAFFVKNKEKIAGKNILLVDDVFTTGATLEEAARVLKEARAKKIVGIVIARASPGQDKLT
jgi:competence protein ComFC